MTSRPIRPVVATLAATALAASVSPAAAVARGAICVDERSGCFATLQAAVDAAHDGDTIRIGKGHFAGGVTITKSVTIAGAGARWTVIGGGGPVMTIGEFGAASEPTVAISGVTITGGRTTGGPFPDFEHQIALGGGVFVPPADSGPGATVTISDSVISGNRVAPPESAPVGPPCPGGRPCPFAKAEGGGISTFGPMTLKRTVVTGNSVGSAARLPDASSDADGGGIRSHDALTLIGSAVVDNRASASAPNGRFAEGGGIFTDGPSTTMRGGELSGNVAKLASALPSDVEQLAVGAAIQVGNEEATTTFDGVRIEGNRLVSTNTAGDATAFSAGPHVFGTLVMRDSTVAHNRIVASVPAGAPGDVNATSGGIEIDDNGTVIRSRFVDNSVMATSPNNVLSGGAGLEVAPLAGEVIAIRDTVVRANVLVAHAGETVTAQGGGIQNGGELTLDRVGVTRNAVVATGHDGVAQGGGVWNGTFDYDGAPPAPVLTLRDSTIRKNTIAAGRHVTAEGGGVFSDSPITLDDTRIVANRPDQCVGC